MQKFFKKFIVAFLLSVAAMAGAQGPSTQIDPGRISWTMNPTATTAALVAMRGVSLADTSAQSMGGALVLAAGSTFAGINFCLWDGTTATNCPPSSGGGGIGPNPTGSQVISQPAGRSFTVQTVNTASGSPIKPFVINVNSSGPGFYDNNGGWHTVTGLNMQLYNNSSAITQAHSGNVTNETSGDTALWYYYMLAYCGQRYGSDEGCKGFNAQLYQVGRSTANIAVPTIGSTIEPFLAAPSGQTNLFVGPNNLFPVTATLQTLTLPASVTATAQTATVALWTPGATPGTAVIGTTFTINIAASSSGQTFTNGTDFSGIIPTAGQGASIYFPMGVGTGTSALAEACFSGPPTSGTTVTYSTTGCGGSGGIQLQATQTAPTTGSTQLAFTNFGVFARNDGNLGQSQFGWTTTAPLLDLQNLSSTATISGQSNVLGDPLVFTLTGITLPVSTAWGHIVACFNISPHANTPNYTSTSCLMALATSPASPGNFAAGTDIHLAGAQAGGGNAPAGYEEEALVTSVTGTACGTVPSGDQCVTFNTRFPWGPGTGTLVMQGGPQSQFAVPSTGLVGNYWPVSYMVLGAFASNQVAFSNCYVGDCFEVTNAPVYAPFPQVAINLTRSSNVVSVTRGGNPLVVTGFQVGSTVVVSGCSVDTDLNGSFVVTVSSLDNFNPVLQWAQTGSNEGPDSTCTISEAPEQLTFVPGAIIVSSTSTGNLTAATNQVPWTVGDYVTVAPSSEYNMVGLKLFMGQGSPASGSGAVSVEDAGPVAMQYAFQATNTQGGGILPNPSPMMFDINGNYASIFNIHYRPANNGCLLCILGNEPMTSSNKPYYVFKDFASGDYILEDTVNNQFVTNRPIIAATGASQFGANSSVGGPTELICTYDGTTATHCPTANIAPGANGELAQYTSTSAIGPINNIFYSANGLQANSGGFRGEGTSYTYGGVGAVNGSNLAQLVVNANGTEEDLNIAGSNFHFVVNHGGAPFSSSSLNVTTGDWTIGATNDCGFQFAIGSTCKFTADTLGDIGAATISPTTLYSAAGTALPTCGSSSKGENATVLDATAPSYMGAYTSGGGITVQVICSYNGTTYAWLTH